MKAALLSLLLPICMMGIGPISTSNAQEDGEAKWTGPQWEYLVLRIEDRRRSSPAGTTARGSASQDKLNELGKQGWELVAVRNDGTSEPVFYFKRKKS